MVPIPSWAISMFGGSFLLVLAIAGWGIKLAINHMSSDIEKIGEKITDVKNAVGELDKRVVCIETILNGRSGPFTPPPLPPS